LPTSTDDYAVAIADAEHTAEKIVEVVRLVKEAWLNKDRQKLLGKNGAAASALEDSVACSVCRRSGVRSAVC
jgi:rRNA processing protein Krr1/Pno1